MECETSLPNDAKIVRSNPVHDEVYSIQHLCDKVQSVPITTKVVSSNPVHALNTTRFVSDLRQVGGFLRVLRFPPPIKLTATI
jgi:hypothetical protein